MTPYKNEKSGVVAYEFVGYGIIVEFKGGRRYRYDGDGNDLEVISAMRALAQTGEGLSSYISKQKPAFTLLTESD